MNAEYKIHLRQNVYTEEWESKVAYKGDWIPWNGNQIWRTFETKTQAMMEAEGLATLHAKELSSRESYDFFPSL